MLFYILVSILAFIGFAGVVGIFAIDALQAVNKKAVIVAGIILTVLVSMVIMG